MYLQGKTCIIEMLQLLIRFAAIFSSASLRKLTGMQAVGPLYSALVLFEPLLEKKWTTWGEGDPYAPQGMYLCRVTPYVQNFSYSGSRKRFPNHGGGWGGAGNWAVAKNKKIVQYNEGVMGNENVSKVPEMEKYLTMLTRNNNRHGGSYWTLSFISNI